LGHLIFLDLIDLEDPVPLFNGEPDLIHHARAVDGRFLITGMHTFLTSGGGGEDARFTQALHELIIVSILMYRMIKPLWCIHRTFEQTFQTKACFFILTNVSYVNDRMTHRELEILKYVGV